MQNKGKGGFCVWILMQTIYISLQTDKHDSNSSLNFFTDWMLFQCQTNSIKALKSIGYWFVNTGFKPKKCGHCSTSCCYLSI